MIKEQKIYKALKGVFIEAKIEGDFVNLIRIKSRYSRKIEAKKLQKQC